MEQGTSDPQFDSYLGGSQAIPIALYLPEFIKSRMEEVVMLTETIKESPFRGQTFQKLPKHMRRRQMSHYIKRLPRKLQRPYLLSLKDAPPTPTKCPSRKYRRRPGNLLVEYNRRQRDHIWLETHIWHAKRFHMVKKWGYKLPERPTNKNYRACYRAISEHCLLTDISYYNCIELTGSEADILEGLKQCTSSECGLTFAAKTVLSGSREGSVTLFHPNSYPYRVIGNVTFMWKPIVDGVNHRAIWIWVHPLIHDETVECLKTLFNLSPQNIVSCQAEVMMNGNDDESTNKSKFKKKQKKQNKGNANRIEQIKLKPKNVPFVRTPKFTNENKSIVMTLLKDTLNRFQLVGPLSQAIISQAFKVIPVISPREEPVDFQNAKRTFQEDDDDVVEIVNKKMKTMSGESHSSVVELEKNWWEQYYSNNVCRQNWESQISFYNKLSNCSKPTDAPSRMILALVVGDPRLTVPSKREKAVPNSQEPCQIPSNSIELGLCQSPIWDPDIRDQTSMRKLSTQQINEAKSKKIVPGFDATDVVPDQMQSRIPILLVQKPGQGDGRYGKLGLGSGWDIIAPAGFGMPIWLSLIFRGAKSGGLRESELLLRECSHLSRYFQPDSAAGESESRSKQQELRTRYFNLPPDKRPNYIKLGSLSPFYCPWKVLVKDWLLQKKKKQIKTESGEIKFSVLRNKIVLNELNDVVGKFKRSRAKINFSNILKNVGMDCLVPVVIEYVGKGKPKNLTQLSLPKKEDFKMWSDKKLGPVEPIHSDDNGELRKQLKLDHSKVLKALRRKRKKDRSKLKEEFAKNPDFELKWSDIVKTNTAPSKQISEEHKAKMESLWLPDEEKIDSIINSCSRKLLGFGVKGDFSLSKSTGVVLGYVTLPGLLQLFTVCRENKSDLVILVRNADQVQYRFGKVGILCE